MVLANVEQVIKLAEKILNKKKCSVNKAIDIAIKILSRYEYEGMLKNEIKRYYKTWRKVLLLSSLW